MFVLENVCLLPQKPLLNITVYTYKRSLIPCTESIARANIFTPSVDSYLTWFKLFLIIDPEERHHLTPQTGKCVGKFTDWCQTCRISS